MGRPKGSRNKKPVECTPPPVREEPAPLVDEKAEVIDVTVKVLIKAGATHDGVYVVGTMKNGKPYIGKFSWCDVVPQTKELKKKLGVE